MLFPRNALASGPQACFFAEKAIAKVKVGNDNDPPPHLESAVLVDGKLYAAHSNCNKVFRVDGMDGAARG
jgi:hypothetical protein